MRSSNIVHKIHEFNSYLLYYTNGLLIFATYEKRFHVTSLIHLTMIQSFV